MNEDFFNTINLHYALIHFYISSYTTCKTYARQIIFAKVLSYRMNNYSLQNFLKCCGQILRLSLFKHASVNKRIKGIQINERAVCQNKILHDLFEVNIRIAVGCEPEHLSLMPV